MAHSKLKSVAKVPYAPPPAQPVDAPRLSLDDLCELATRLDPTQPPAIISVQEGSELLTLCVRTPLADAIRHQAEAESITVKMVITRALAAADLPVSAVDLDEGRASESDGLLS